MQSSITMTGIVKDIFDRLPDLKDSAVFCRYVGDQCMDLWTDTDDCYRWSYNNHTCLWIESDSYFMDQYESTLFPMSEQTYLRNFSELLGGRMLARQISRRKLAERTGLSENSIYRYLNFQRKPTAYSHYILSWYLEGVHQDQWKLL